MMMAMMLIAYEYRDRLDVSTCDNGADRGLNAN